MGDIITKAAGVDEIGWIAEHNIDSVMQDTAYTATGRCNGHPQTINYIEEYLDYIQRDATYYVKELEELHWDQLEMFESESIPQTIKSISRQGVQKSNATSNQWKANTIDLSQAIEIEATDLSESVKEFYIPQLCTVAIRDDMNITDSDSGYHGSMTSLSSISNENVNDFEQLSLEHECLKGELNDTKFIIDDLHVKLTDSEDLTNQYKEEINMLTETIGQIREEAEGKMAKLEESIQQSNEKIDQLTGLNTSLSKVGDKLVYEAKMNCLKEKSELTKLHEKDIGILN